MKIRPMTQQELDDYRERTIASFAAEKMRAEGVAEDVAREAAVESWQRAAPGDGDDRHVIGHLEVDGQAIGVVWFVVRPEWGQPCLWLYDIAIDPAHRGRGLGRRAMELLEAQARQCGAQVIGLHVFGHNTVARSLYESLGFRPTSIVMRKDLGS